MGLLQADFMAKSLEGLLEINSVKNEGTVVDFWVCISNQDIVRSKKTPNGALKTSIRNN